MAFRSIQLNFSSVRDLNTLLVWSYLSISSVSVFNRPISCMPTRKPAAKKLKQEDFPLKYFMEIIPLDPLTNLILKKELLKNITTWLHLDRNMRLWTFSWHKIYCRQNRPKNCIVHNVGKLRSPLMLSACKEGTQVPIRMYWILIMY